MFGTRRIGKGSMHPGSLGLPRVGQTQFDDAIAGPPPGYVATKSISFDGVNEFLSRANAAAHQFTTAMTISAWIKCSIQAGYGAIVFKGLADGADVNEWDYSLFPNADPYQQGCGTILGQADADYTFIDSQLTSVDGAWHHVVLTFGSSTTKIYTDGVLDTDTISFRTGSFSSLLTSTNALNIGRQASSAVSVYYSGRMTNISLWNAALSLAQINELVSSSKPADLVNHSLYATNCVSWYKLGDGDTIGANGVLDTKGGLHLSPTNMDSSNIVSDAP